MEDVIRMLNLGLDLAKEERFAESVEELKRALELNINDETKKIVLFQIALCLIRLEKYEEAEAYLLKYLDITEDLDAYYLLSIVYDHTFKKDNEQGVNTEREKALVVYEKIHALNPEDDAVMIKIIVLKNVLKKELSENDCLDAVASMNRLIESKKVDDHFEAIKLRVYGNMFDVASKLIDPDTALHYFDSLAASMSEEEKEADAAYKGLLGSAFGQGLYSELHDADRHIRMMSEMYRLFTPLHENTFDYDSSGFRGINVGFLSSDLRIHPVGRFLFSLFKEKISNSGINYFCYDTLVIDETKDKAKDEDPLTVQIKSLADKYVDISKMDEDEAEKLIIGDRLDILFDLNVLSFGGKRELVLRRLAPVMLTWIGWPSTSAVKNADYCIVDYDTDPTPYSQQFYTEKLVYMSKTFLCYPLIFDYDNDPKLEINDSPFKKNGYVTFGSFANGLKYSKKILGAWSAILNCVKNSRLVIRSTGGVNDKISANAIKRKFENSGIDMSRVDFLEPAPFGEYMSCYNDVDIILDTFPFNGATTTCDAFSMGVPVVSLYGERHHERVGLSMLKNVGLEDLATPTCEEYIKKATELANDQKRFMDLRKTLREVFKNSPLADSAAFKIEFENVMRKLHIGYCMENCKKASVRGKSVTELASETARGFYFIKNLLYTDSDRNVVNHVKNELFVLQKALIKILLESSESEKERQLYVKYGDCVDLLFGDRALDELRQITKAGEEILKNIF